MFLQQHLHVFSFLQVAVKLFTSGNPTLYSFQQSLPKLPVPSLDDTLDKVRYQLTFPLPDQPKPSPLLFYSV